MELYDKIYIFIDNIYKNFILYNTRVCVGIQMWNKPCNTFFKINLFIFSCVGPSLLCAGFL